jgi:hypothetical protein
MEKGRKSNIPQKVLQYFSIKSKLEWLFMTKGMTKEMHWHKEDREDDDNTIKHLTNSIVWKKFDKIHEWFASDFHNVQLSLPSDGFNLYGNEYNI